MFVSSEIARVRHQVPSEVRPVVSKIFAVLAKVSGAVFGHPYVILPLFSCIFELTRFCLAGVSPGFHASIGSNPAFA